mmetsp:Transcript_15481/g.33684  ORF Transcript_15481/g.33684 Transcript_15481/m.33684 type:complete len:250 (+) Transcript_15481:136-885(+)|eukprot:CAMPEP_0178490850 /NCGR_PEP_ID=MMETSP0696-20121128/11102_1 /TAXON_ID=265572 /ORGANISM="Extubocellulus spinifer, Strain CCMP396" /LENGTH=249 /DNA_ID=CAMNT_0020118691 /DNA_START=81 /DNA_END=830 /DNA_ORIENTATION=-
MALDTLHALSDVQRDALATCLVFCYVLALISGCEALVSNKLISSALSRKIVHIGAASWLIFWPLYSDHEAVGNWSWKLNVLVPAVKGIELFIKGAIIRDPNDKDVRAISRTGNPKELLLGPLQFTIVMTLVGLYLFRQSSACLIMGAVGIGDGIAPIIGAQFGRHKYMSPFSRNSKGFKSFEGSLAVFIGTMFGYYVYSFVISARPLLSISSVMASALLAACVEGIVPSNVDNIAVPLAMYLVYTLLLS